MERRGFLKFLGLGAGAVAAAPAVAKVAEKSGGIQFYESPGPELTEEQYEEVFGDATRMPQGTYATCFTCMGAPTVAIPWLDKTNN